MTEQWQELKETITEMRDNDGTGTQQDACKFLVDYMEVLEKQMQQPTEKCKGCYYNDGDTHAECVVCDKESRPTDAVSCNCTTEEIAKSFIEDVEAVKDQLEQQPSEDCISRQAVIILIDEASEMHPYKVVGDSNTYSNYNQGWSDACDWLYANIEGVPSVIPQRKRGKWVEVDGECQCSNCERFFPLDAKRLWVTCPRCNSYNGGGEDET